MNRLLLSASIGLLYISPLAAQSQSSQAEAYDFNGDRLGMTLSEFKAKYHKLANGMAPTGRLYVSCEEKGRNLTSCHSPTIAWDVAVDVNTLFVDGKLAVTEVLFSNDDTAQDTIGRVERGLLGKLGTTTSNALHRFNGGKEATVERWENSVSVVQFEFHLCGRLNGKPADQASNILSALEGHYGIEACQLLYSESEIIYLHKDLSRLTAARIKEGSPP